MSLAPITLDRFILEAQQVSPGATGALSLLLMRFGVAGKRIASALSRAGLTGTLGAAGSRNVQGEEQKKLDVVANEILVETFDYGKLVGLAASEEMEEPVVYAAGATGAGGYAVLFDPLDGSSNIDCNGTLGTIFSIRRRPTAARPTCCARGMSRWPRATSSSDRPCFSSTPRATARISSRWTLRSASSC